MPIGTENNYFLNHRWMVITNEERMMLDASFFGHLNIPIEFAKAMDSVLTSETTLLITDKPTDK